MQTLKTRTTIMAAIAATLLFAAAAGAATLYFHYVYYKSHVASTLQATVPQAVPTPDIVTNTPPPPEATDIGSIKPIVAPKPKQAFQSAVSEPKLTVATSTATVAPIAQDHCSNIAGVQATVPEGMSHDATTGTCTHIPTAAEIAQQIAEQEAATNAINAAQQANQLTEIDALNKQIADLDNAYASQDQTNISYFRTWQAKRAALVAQRDQIQYAQQQ